MKNFFNIIGICALMSYLFFFPSCEKSYDEEELLRDIEKKKYEMAIKDSINEAIKDSIEKAFKDSIDAISTNIFIFNGDTFILPVKVIPEYHKEYYTIYPPDTHSDVESRLQYIDSCYYTYSFLPSDKDKIKKCLFEQTQDKSELGNFVIFPYIYGFEPGNKTLYDVVYVYNEKNDYWNFKLANNNIIGIIKFNSDNYFSIQNDTYYIDENGNIDYLIRIPIKVTPNDASN